MLNRNFILPFQRFIYRFYQDHGRHDLPWRQDFEPYKVMVSEIMLQQTQVDRVIPKFNAFLAEFPTIQALAAASPGQVIQAWQGLGYNRRGLNLQRAAQVVVSNFAGSIPQNKEELLSLPGIGPYTATAIQTFAFNQPQVVIETNIRTIFIYHFFPGAYQVSDQELLPLIELTIDQTQPRHWYSALMDYGSYLKKVLPNPSRQSKRYVRQTPFAGSRRQLRGEILRRVSQQGPLLETDLLTLLPTSSHQPSEVLEQLISEGLIVRQQQLVKLPD